MPKIDSNLQLALEERISELEQENEILKTEVQTLMTMNDPKEKKMIITIVKAYDHFTTHSDTKECFIEAIGENIGEDEMYLWLRSLRIFYPEDSDPEDKVQKIIKSTIIKRANINFDRETMIPPEI